MPDSNDWNRQTIEAFRANGGKVGGMWEGRPLLLLTTTGARSGRRRTHPLMYLRDDDCLLVFASGGGRQPIPTGTTICSPTPNSPSRWGTRPMTPSLPQ
jgi:F420H(2)-dependent quinone reductase